MRKGSTSIAWLMPVVAVMLIGLVRAQDRVDTRHFVSSNDCRFEFDYPRDWVVVPMADPPPCRVRLRPVDFADRMKKSGVDVYTLNVAVEHDNFLAVAADRDFDFVRGRWVLVGRHSIESDVEIISTERWHGVRGNATVGCYDRSGSYRGLCEEPALVLRDDDNNVWSMRGGPQSEHVFDEILATFRFRP